MDIWVASSFELLWILLLWMFVYNFLYGHMFISFAYNPWGLTAGTYGKSVVQETAKL
jgi:hypothetical protein